MKADKKQSSVVQVQQVKKEPVLAVKTAVKAGPDIIPQRP